MKRAREDGFTLIEALAAVVVTTAILAGLAAIAGQWLPNWRHGFSTLQNADLMGLALDRIVEDVGSAEYARLDGASGPPLFRGGPDAVVFVRRAIGPNAGPRLEIVRIGAAAGGVERARAAFQPGAIGAFGDAATLLRPPFRLSFAYAGPDGVWRTVWGGGDKLPQAMRIAIANEGGAVWATTAFRLKVSAGPEIAVQPLAAEGNAPAAAK